MLSLIRDFGIQLIRIIDSENFLVVLFYLERFVIDDITEKKQNVKT